MSTGIRMKNPAHPGGFVKTEIIEPDLAPNFYPALS